MANTTYLQLDDLSIMSSDSQSQRYHPPVYDEDSFVEPLIESSATKNGATIAMNKENAITVPWHKGWFFEILAMCLATVSLAAIVAVLAYYRDRERPEWDFRITLNTVVSALATLFQGGLFSTVASCISQFGWISLRNRPRPLNSICHHDNASRGIIGSLEFMWKYNIRRLGSIGALTIVLAAALFPFFQQTIRYELRTAIDHDRVALTVAASTWNVTGTGSPFGGSRALLPYNMQTAVYSGLMSAGTVRSPSPPYVCQSGNCTWDPYHALAVNVQCIDMSDSVVMNCTRSPPPELCISDQGICGPSCQLEPTADNEWLQTAFNSSSIRLVMTMNATMGRWAAYRGNLPWLKPFADISVILQLITWVKATGGLAWQPAGKHYSYVSENTTFEAKTCALYLSLQEMSTRLVSGRYEDTILREHRLAKDADSLRFNPDRDDRFNMSVIDVFDHYVDLVYEADSADRSQPPSPAFTVGSYAWRALTDMLTAAIMPSAITGHTAKVTYGSSMGAHGTTDTALILYLAPNSTQVLVNTAAMITNAIRGQMTQLRQAETQNSSLIIPEEAVAGQTMIQAQFVVIYWAWLILPVICWLLAIVFLILTITLTNRKRSGLWKSSPLALLLHALIKPEMLSSIRKDHAQLLRSQAGMEDVSAHLTMQLERSTNGDLIVIGEETNGRS